jgi:hypothetical protein
MHTKIMRLNVTARMDCIGLIITFTMARFESTAIKE